MHFTSEKMRPRNDKDNLVTFTSQEFIKIDIVFTISQRYFLIKLLCDFDYLLTH